MQLVALWSSSWWIFEWATGSFFISEWWVCAQVIGRFLD
jgi:hypothetical protein